MKLLPLLAFFVSAASSTYGAVLISINISDISAITFTSTSNTASANSSLNASSQGFTIEEFFVGAPTLTYTIGNVTGTLTPTVGTTQTYVAVGTYDFSGGTEAFGPGNDLNFTAGGNAGANSQVFDTGTAVFSGVAILDLSGYSGNMPTVGASGSIYPGFSIGPSVAGEWVVVPEPSTFLLSGLAGLMGISRRRRA